MFNTPLPEFNTGLGFCYFPDDAHYRQTDAQAWIPELKALGASWLTLTGSATSAIPEAFIKALIDSSIEPIIHIPIPASQAVDLAALETLYTSYARWGVHYIVLYDKPNLKSAWSAENWAQVDLVSRFVDLLLPTLQLADRLGLVPVFPPLQQGGDYWDTAFLDLALSQMRVRNQMTLLSRMVIAHYAFAFNRPTTWGEGGHTKWTRTQPYSVPTDSQDQRGFHSFEWYEEVIQARLGMPRPLLMIAGGARLGDNSDPAYDTVDDARHATCNIEIMQAMSNGQLPGYVMNVAYYLLAAQANTPPAASAWYQASGSTLTAVGAMKQQVADALQALANAEKRLPGVLVKRVKRNQVKSEAKAAADTESEAPILPIDKALYHYLLLPSYEWGVANWHWQAVWDYVSKFQPACGFSIDEALTAEYVTIVGNEQGISLEMEQTLRDAGCLVERICGQDGAETKQRLTDLAQAGLRFAALTN